MPSRLHPDTPRSIEVEYLDFDEIIETRETAIGEIITERRLPDDETLYVDVRSINPNWR